MHGVMQMVLQQRTGNTREAALKYATGKWITFIDNDDILDSDVPIRLL